MANKNIEHTPDEQSAIGLLNAEMAKWFNGEVTVTDKVSFSMRTRIKQFRKNYWGAYDTPNEPSGRPKMWYPLTQWFTDLFYRNTNRGTKNIDFKSRRAGSYGNAQIAQHITRHYLYKENFDAIMDDFRFRCGMDGTAVNKTVPGATGSNLIDSKNVDLLNFVIDPTAENIQEATSVIEIIEMGIDEYMAQDRWDNKEQLQALLPDELNYVPRVRVMARWGKMQESKLTDGNKDSKKWVESMLIVSELIGDTSENNSVTSEKVDSRPQAVNKMVKSPFKLRPYEEAWFIKVPGRWYGMGVPEMVLDNQQLANENWNMRINNGRILKNGLFKVRIGSGVTQQMLSKITAGGAIPVKRMDDLEQMQMQDYRASSYEDEDRINALSQRVLGATPQAGGEPLPASTPATIGVINQQNAATSFETIGENLDNAFERIIQRHWLPIIFSDIKADEIYRITGDRSDIEFLVDKYSDREADKAILSHYVKNPMGGVTPADKDILKSAIKQRFSKFGKDQFVKNIHEDVLNEDYDIHVTVGDSKMDKAAMVAQLRQFLVESSQIPGVNIKSEEVAKEIAELIGIGGERFFDDKVQTESALPQAPGKLKKPQETPTDRTINQGVERGPTELLSR